MAAKKEKKPLISPDLERCQAEKPNGHSFMTLGGSPGLERCTNKPVGIVTENKPDADGKKGSMALCGDCFLVFGEQVPKGVATWKELPKPQWVEVFCDLCNGDVAFTHPKGGLRCDKCPRPER